MKCPACRGTGKIKHVEVTGEPSSDVCLDCEDGTIPQPPPEAGPEHG